MIQISDFSFLLLILLSFLMVRFGFDSKVFDSIPKLLFTFCYPALIITSFSVVDSTLSSQYFLHSAIFAFVVTGLVFLISCGVLRGYKNSSRKEIIIFYMMIGNITFVGLPFIFFFFGALGLSLAILIGVLQDIYIWSLNYTRFSRRGSFRQTIKALGNPCFIALVVGLAVNGSGTALPEFISMPARMLADATIPLALLCIGGILAQNRGILKKLDFDVIMVVTIKTFIVPVIAFLIFRAIGVSFFLSFLFGFIMTLPAPILSILFSKEFGCDVEFANSVFVLSVIAFSLLSVALFVLQSFGFFVIAAI